MNSCNLNEVKNM